MTHQIIKTDNYILITSDEEIKVGDWCILFDSVGNLFYDIPLQYTDSKNQHINKYLRKVIAHLPPNNSSILEGVPLLPPLDDEDEFELDNDNIDKGVEKNGLGYVNGYYGGFVDGVKKAKEKYKFTEEDVIKIVEKSRETGLTAEYLMLSLSQPKLPVGFKCEMVSDIPSTEVMGEFDSRPKIINGVMQGEWIFE